MGLLTGIGNGVRGLLGDAAFLDHLAQAEAFANGDPTTAARIGQGIRERRKKQSEAGRLPPPAAALPGTWADQGRNPAQSRGNRDGRRP